MVGACGARAVSRKTLIYFIDINLVIKKLGCSRLSIRTGSFKRDAGGVSQSGRRASCRIVGGNQVLLDVLDVFVVVVVVVVVLLLLLLLLLVVVVIDD